MNETAVTGTVAPAAAVILRGETEKFRVQINEEPKQPKGAARKGT